MVYGHDVAVHFGCFHPPHEVGSMMEIAALTSFLAPLLPMLLDAGERAANAIAEKFGDDVAGFARRLWDKLRNKVEEKDSAKEAAQDVAEHPDDDDSRAALRVQLGKILEGDPDLASELAKIWEEASRAGAVNKVINVTVSGERAVGIGGNVEHSTIITGDDAPRSV